MTNSRKPQQKRKTIGLESRLSRDRVLTRQFAALQRVYYRERRRSHLLEAVAKCFNLVFRFQVGV